jgi:hypothetical protein
MYNQLKLTTCIKSRVGFLLFFEKLYLSIYLPKELELLLKKKKIILKRIKIKYLHTVISSRDNKEKKK